MEQEIRFCTTSDGVRIAYATAGEGLPLVVVPVQANSHMEHSWELLSPLFHGLARTFRLVRYDSRGSGLSDREAIDFSIGAMIRDLEAVVARTGLESFALCAFVDAVPIAVTYAASQPERVSHLILCDGWTKFSDYAQSPAYRMEAELRDKDWVLFTETFAQVLWSFEDPSFARQFAEYMRVCVEPDAWRAAQAAMEAYDVSALLPLVMAPTLVVHNRSNRWQPLQSGQRIAAGLADARFVIIDDRTYASVPELIQEFLGEDEESAGEVAPSGLVTILFTDMEGSTTLTQRLGDAGAQEVLRTHNRIIRDALKAHEGSETKHTGDGIMASFAGATHALECAVAIQRAFAAHNDSRPETPIRVRIGLNAGEPIAEDEDLFGTAVQLAARICAHAEPGQILASNVVRELVAGKKFLFSDRGEVALRGFDDPVRLYEVEWRD